ncbi:MAG TPA: MurT ligase domain-containing protein [Marmoricola sp.]|nr:MurT ligase domain-containing protein [Marmoricola sp.]
MRFRMALLLARVAAGLSRRLGRGSGRVIGGAVLLRLAPADIASRARACRITIVSGTNGKSTTTAMITSALRTRGPVSTNADGANTPHGLAWAVATAASDEIVLEVDESWVPWAVHTLRPRAAVLLNLTRDQLHRKPEILPLAEAWRAVMPLVDRVVANADDPAVVWAAMAAPRVEYVVTGAQWVLDSVLCPRCQDVLRDRAGEWSSACGLRRPPAAVRVCAGRIEVDGILRAAYDALPGPANLANAATAVAAVRDRVPPEAAVSAIAATVHDVAGRYREVWVDGRRVRLLLAKNPAGWQAVVKMLRDDASALLAFSADGVDGRDTSWLYDVDFEPLRGRRVAVTGPRAMDLAVRLHLDGIEPAPVLPSVRAGVDVLPPGDVDLVATYSAFQSARRELHVA